MPLNSLAAQPIDSKACSDLRGDLPREFPPLSDRLHHEQQMRVLISGAGIARLTVAYWLRRYGYSDHSRAGTITTERVYKIEVRGIALQVLRRMGVHDAVVAAGLFNAYCTPLYERLTVGSMAAIQRAWAMFSMPLARAMLSTWLRSLAMMPGLMRMRLASSARVTSRT